MKELRLLLFKDCNRKCRGCCNKDWDLDNLPTCKSFKGYKTIMLTSGEPMLNPDLVMQTILKIRKQNKSVNIYMYTAKINDYAIPYLNCVLDGITLTLHNQSDVKNFVKFNNKLSVLYKLKSLRLNIFKGVKLPKDIDLSYWKVKRNIKWIKNCPLPKHEVFMKL